MDRGSFLSALGLVVVLLVPVPVHADTRSFVCNISEITMREALARTSFESWIMDGITVTQPDCGGIVNPGDTVTVQFLLETPVVIDASANGPNASWRVGAGLRSDPYNGGQGGDFSSFGHSIRVTGTNVITTSIDPNNYYVYVSPSLTSVPLAQFGVTGLGSLGAVVDPQQDAVITGAVVTMEIPNTFGGYPTIVGANMAVGTFFIQAQRVRPSDPSIVVGPMLAVGLTDGQLNDLQQDTTSLLQAESLSASVISSLTTKITQAFSQIQSGQPAAAAGQLRGYVNEVNGLVNSGNISEDAAETLTTAAMELITRIRPRTK